MALENEETTTDETPEGGEATELPSLFDAITDAIEPTLPEATQDDSDVDEETDEVTDETDEDETDEEAEATDGDGVTVDARGRKHGPDGKLLPADDKAKAGDGAGKDGVKLGPDGKPLVDDKSAAKKTDPVNDPIPDEVKGRTRERMQSLITAVKEKDQMIETQHQLFDSIKSTGASPEEFGAMLGYMRWVHSDKPEDLKQAKELLLSELRGISLKLGEAAPGVNFLAEHPDLQEQVNNGQILQSAAEEIAIHRTRTKNETERRTADQEREAATQAANTERTNAIAELDGLGKTLNETDPDFAVKHAILKPVLASLGQLPPKQWKAAFTQAYKAIDAEEIAAYKARRAAPAAGAAKPGQKVVQGQPLRANKVPTGGQNRQPTSLLDAVSAGIDAAG